MISRQQAQGKKELEEITGFLKHDVCGKASSLLNASASLVSRPRMLTAVLEIRKTK